MENIRVQWVGRVPLTTIWGLWDLHFQKPQEIGAVKWREIG